MNQPSSRPISRSPFITAPSLLILPLITVALGRVAHSQDIAATPDPTPSATPSTAATEVEIEPVANNDAAASADSNAANTADEEAVTPPVDSATTNTTAAAATPATAASGDTPTDAQGRSTGRLTAGSIRYEGGVVIAEGVDGKPVLFETADARIEAKSLRLDTIKRTLNAEGTVKAVRRRAIAREALVSPSLSNRGIFPKSNETVTETFTGEKLNYDFNTQKGSVDNARLELSSFSVSTDQLIINGRLYTARNVLLRPGGLTAEEERVYGTPPFNLRAKTVTVESTTADNASGSASQNGVPENGANVSTTPGALTNARISVKGAGLYYKNTRLLPVPSYVFSRINLGPRNPQAFSLIPRISFSSADRVLLTTQLRFPLSAAPTGPAVTADIGLSQRIGLRGGLRLDAPTNLGNLSLGLRKSDIVTTQLTNRIELDRLPELNFNSRLFPLFRLPGGRVAGIDINAGTGRYLERQIGESNSKVDTSRTYARINFTTRGADVPGPYLDLFARVAKYGNRDDRYTNTGFEIGYAGNLLNRVKGALSYRRTSISGETPFRFDKIEIANELRSTLDFQLTPRYIIPLDLRYDLDRDKLRDTSFGLLRSYKTFAYGAVYQSARNEVRFEVRQGF